MSAAAAPVRALDLRVRASLWILLSLWLGAGAGLAEAAQPAEGIVREAKALAAEGRTAEAERALSRAHARGGGVEVSLALAELLAQSNRASEATSLLVAESRRLGSDGQEQAARTLLERGLDLLPDRAPLSLELGRVELAGRRFSAAEGPLERALELSGNDLRTLLYVAAMRWEIGRIEDSESAYRRALDASGRSAATLHQLGRLLLWAGRAPDAAALLTEAASKAGPSLEIDLDLGAALAAADQPERALEVLGGVVARAPDYGRARYLLGRQLQAAGDREGARRELEAYRRLYQRDQAATRSAGLEQAALDRGVELLRRGLPEAAVGHLESLPETPAVLATLADALLAAGQEERAVSVLERALRESPDREDLQMRLEAARAATERP